MYGELPGYDDFRTLKSSYMGALDPGLKRQILKTVERKLEDLLGFAEKYHLSGYDMPTWRRLLFVPFDAGFNGLITDYCEAIEAAQRKRFSREKFNDKLKLSGRQSPPVESAFYRELADFHYDPWQD